MPAAVLFGGNQPWLRRLLGISVAPQVGNGAVRDNTAKRWNGVVAQRTVQWDANNHRPYPVTRKSLDAAGCTGEPLLVIASNRVFLCILHCCMAFGKDETIFLLKSIIDSLDKKVDFSAQMVAVSLLGYRSRHFSHKFTIFHPWAAYCYFAIP